MSPVPPRPVRCTCGRRRNAFGWFLMVRKLLMTAGVGALVAMAIGGASFASASGEGGGRTIVVIEKTTSQQFVDFHQAGPTAGDEFFFAEIAEDVSCSGMATAEADCGGTRRPSVTSCSGRRGSSPRAEIFPARGSAHRADSRDALGGRRGGGLSSGDGCLPGVRAHAAPVWRGFVSPTIVAPVPNDRSPFEPSAVVGGDGRRAARLVRRRGGRRRRVVLRGRARWSSPGVPARERDGAVAAGGRGDGCARDSGAGHLAGNRDRRFVGGRLLDAVGDGAGSDAREHARGRCCGGSVPSAGGAADRARAGLGRARTRASAPRSGR